MSSHHQLTIALGLLAIFLAGPAPAQHFCDDPPSVTILTGESISVSGLSSEGHPSAFEWYITAPGGPVPSTPTSTKSTHAFVPAIPGLWSIALVAQYDHTVIGGGLWSSEDCVTLETASVVSAITLSSTQVATDEPLLLSGANSRWAAVVTPEFEWQVDGQPFGSCNGGPSPATPADLHCTIPADWLAPGWHTAGLRLTDPSSGQSSLASADFEVIEVIPLAVDFIWSPFHPDPGQLVHFVSDVVPATPEADLTHVVWNMGDGTEIIYDSCPPFYGSCLEMPHTYADDGWYTVSLTVETVSESAGVSHEIEVGDPVVAPQASFTSTPSSPMLLETTVLTFDGACEGDCTWAWDFGDGTLSTEQNPNHTWITPDTYTVTLTVTNQSGSASTSLPIEVSDCWNPSGPSQDGTCYGGPARLTADTGIAWIWSTGAGSQTIAISQPGGYWVNVENGSGCWGHTPTTAVLVNCGDPTGDANLDGDVDGADPAALIPELTDGDGDTVVGSGGGDLTAPGGDVTGDDRLRVNDLQAVLTLIFD